MTNESCDFCKPEDLGWRTIRSDELFISFVSRPWFRPGQCLVVPRRHIASVAELSKAEAGDMMIELGRLSLALDEGYGSGIMQKYQPLQTENGIKMNHLHAHVFPRQENEPGLFPTPEPNSFEGFVMPTDTEVITLAHRLQ